MKNQTRPSAHRVLRQLAVASATAALFALPPAAWSLSLGRLTVQSSLGETLRAEIDVSSLSAEEANNLRVRVAPPDAYRVAGIDYNPVLPQTRVTLMRRPDGTPYLSIAADRPIQEPFVDLILELTWNTGRLTREYTLLFDPPASASRPAAAGTTAPQVAAPAPAPLPSAAPAPTPSPAPTVKSTEPPAVAAQPRQPAVREPRAAASEGAEPPTEVRVKPGDTLYRIAARTQPSGISLDQMLAGLFRSNAQAFSGGNMNRLRAGTVLTVPGREDLAAIDSGEARQLIQVQSADFNAYRRRLAAAVPEPRREPDAPRAASGKVQTEVDDRRQAQVPAPDRLRLDKGKAASGASAPEDRIAKERASKESADRAAEIQRNMEALKKLQAASATAPTPAPTTKVAAAASAAAEVRTAPSAAASAAASASIGVAAPAQPALVASAPVAASAPVVVASAPTEAPAAASAPGAASAPVMASASAASAPDAASPAGDEVSFWDSLASNPLVLPGVGLIAALLAGLGYYRMRGKKQEEAGVTSFLESRLQPDSFFGASGGQRVDTRDAGGTPSSMSYSLSQIDAIGDVDPVAEADVYLAYGRDLQAEEILKEAMRANPERLGIRSKLLEVYAKRRDVKGFELLAGELYGLTGGQGEDWSRAQELGRSIDPDNLLYEPGGTPAGDRNVGGMGEGLGATTMPQSIAPSPNRFEHSVPDLDLDHPSLSGNSADVDLDVSSPGALEAAAPSGSSVFSSAPMNFEESAGGAATMGGSAGGMDFDLRDLPAFDTASRSGAASVPGIDLSDLSLDLNAPSVPGPGLGFDDTPGMADDSADALLRKLELAEEFQQIGDTEGARDLLHEVLQRADGTLRARAQALLDQLS